MTPSKRFKPLRKGQLMKVLVVLCLIVLVTSHLAAIILISLGVDGDAVNGWLTLTDATFCTELLAMMVKKITGNKNKPTDEEEGE